MILLLAGVAIGVALVNVRIFVTLSAGQYGRTAGLAANAKCAFVLMACWLDLDQEEACAVLLLDVRELTPSPLAIGGQIQQ